MVMEITFGDGVKVNAKFDNHVVMTDQPLPKENGAPHELAGEDSAPAPFNLFLASIGTCAGLYVLSFCKNRSLPTEGIKLIQENDFDPQTHSLKEVRLTIEVPKDFPEKYYDALIRVADKCAVKKAILNPPNFHVGTRVV